MVKRGDVVIAVFSGDSFPGLLISHIQIILVVRLISSDLP